MRSRESSATRSVEGMTESTQQWATLFASSIAALAASASAVLAAIGAAKARRWTGRDHWWQRFVWAMSTAASSERTDRDAAIEILADLTCGVGATG